jgi:hypothetical protein
MCLLCLLVLHGSCVCQDLAEAHAGGCGYEQGGSRVPPECIRPRVECPEPVFEPLGTHAICGANQEVQCMSLKVDCPSSNTSAWAKCMCLHLQGVAAAVAA